MSDWISERLSDFGPRTAFDLADRCWSFEAFAAEITRLREALKRFTRQQVIELDTQYPVESLAALLAVEGTPHIALPLAADLPPDNRDQVRQTARSGLTHSPGTGTFQAVRAAQAADQSLALCRKIERGGLILLSSGTTGHPKLMLHRLDRLLEPYRNLRPRDERTLLLMPVDHIGGLDAALRSLFSGSRLVVPPQRSPDAVARTIQTKQVTVLPSSPTFLNLMRLAGSFEKYDCGSLRIIAYGAESMPEALLRSLNAALPKVDFQQKFGTSETGAIRTRSDTKDSLYFKIADPNTEWKVVDDELWLRTPSRILGYLNADESSLEADGWYRTGDLVEAIEGGSLRITGRRQDLINVGGEKVTPSEVESVLLEMPEVADCLVYGEANALTGQNVAARIVPRDAAGDPRQLKRRIKQHCRQRLSPYKVPARIVLAEAPLWSGRFKKQRSGA